MATTFPTNRISTDIKNKGTEKAQKGNQPVKEYDIPPGIAAPAKTESSSLKKDASIFKDLARQLAGG